MMYSTVDIIVPVYNVSRYLDRCIKSIQDQSYTDLNIILVDDGSTDESGNICDSFAKTDERIHVIHKKNGGLVSAWRAGVDYSKSEWLVFVDGDDWIEKKHIESLVREQVKTSADIVVTRMKQVDQFGEKYIEFVIPDGEYSDLKLVDDLYPVLINAGKFEKRGVPFSRCSKLIRKKIMVKNLDYSYERATYEEDFNIIAPCLMDAEIISMIRVDDSAYCYRKVENSMLHGYDKNMLNSISNIYPRLVRACKDKGKDSLLDQIYFEYISAAVRLFLNETKNPNGYRSMRENVRIITEDDLFKKTVKTVSYSAYPYKFYIVLYILKHYDFYTSRILEKIIYTLRKI